MSYQAELTASAIDDRVAEARGYRPIFAKSELEQLGFSPGQRLVPGYLIPIHTVTGEIGNYQYKPDNPRSPRNKIVKYETCPRRPMCLDIHPLIREDLHNPVRPLWITEGAKKVDSAISRGLVCIGVLGVYGWRGSNKFNGREALADWEHIALNGRRVYLAFDSDAWSNAQVGHALSRLGSFLTRRGADVHFVRIPTVAGEKVGLDDFFAARGTVAQLVTAAGKTGPVRQVSQLAPERFTDVGNATELLARCGQNLRYCSTWGRWVVWNGKHWQIDETGGSPAMTNAIKAVQEMLAEAAQITDVDERIRMLRWATGSLNRNRLDAMVFIAKNLGFIPVEPQEFDTDLWLLNVNNGTVDLRTGELREHRREDLISHMIPIDYNKNADANTWVNFLEEIFEGDQELLRYVWKAIGYSLTGATQEQCFFFLYGMGANGKSTFMETLSNILGDGYCCQTPTTTFMTKRSDTTVSNDIARLRGTRIVFSQETEEGRRIDERLIKSLTGGDRVTARFLHQEFFSFIPNFKIWMSGNHKPDVRGTDHAMWRRVSLIPFNLTIAPENRDPNLIAKLSAEREGILLWAVYGCLQWQIEGLRKPKSIQQAVDDYREDSDLLGNFLREETERDYGTHTRCNRMYDRYKDWCKANSYHPLNNKRFGTMMKERGEPSQPTPSAGNHRSYLNRKLLEKPCA